MLNGEIIGDVVEYIARYSEDNAIDKVVLFGSSARGDYMDTSDVDIRIFSSHALEIGLYDFCDIIYDLKQEVMERFMVRLDVSVDGFGVMHDYVQAGFIEDGKVIYERVRDRVMY